MCDKNNNDMHNTNDNNNINSMNSGDLMIEEDIKSSSAISATVFSKFNQNMKDNRIDAKLSISGNANIKTLVITLSITMLLQSSWFGYMSYLEAEERPWFPLICLLSVVITGWSAILFTFSTSFMSQLNYLMIALGACAPVDCLLFYFDTPNNVFITYFGILLFDVLPYAVYASMTIGIRSNDPTLSCFHFERFFGSKIIAGRFLYVYRITLIACDMFSDWAVAISLLSDSKIVFGVIIFILTFSEVLNILLETFYNNFEMQRLEVAKWKLILGIFEIPILIITIFNNDSIDNRAFFVMSITLTISSTLRKFYNYFKLKFKQ